MLDKPFTPCTYQAKYPGVLSIVELSNQLGYLVVVDRKLLPTSHRYYRAKGNSRYLVLDESCTKHFGHIYPFDSKRKALIYANAMHQL